MMDTMLDQISGVSLIDILLKIGFVGYIILFILFGFSMLSWAIILYKYRNLRQIQKESQKFLELYRENNDLSEVYAALCGISNSTDCPGI